jgi:hypothetical protein
MLCCSLQATLVFDMPPGYPAAAAIRCHVTSPQLPRDVIDALSQQLQEQAEDLQVSDVTAAGRTARHVPSLRAPPTAEKATYLYLLA